MKIIKDCEFGGERPLFASKNLRIENVTIHAGESVLKECENIEADKCRFEGKYPFWHVNGFKISDCLFTEGARAAIWYSQNCQMKDCLVEAPKMFREMDGLTLENVQFPNAAETLWMCRDIKMKNVTISKGDYLFAYGSNIEIEDYTHQGNYSFQYCKNVVIRNAKIDSKDAFWNSDNVTVYDSSLDGEYLGWHSHNLRLVRCHISGTQPLCYAHNLILEDCTFGDDADLAFENAELKAQIKGGVVSIKNPRTGEIVCDSVGEVILDENIKAPADCKIIIR